MEEKIQAIGRPQPYEVYVGLSSCPTLPQKPTLARLEVILTGDLEWRVEVGNPRQAQTPVLHRPTTLQATSPPLTGQTETGQRHLEAQEK
ncbi:hypothetical protein I79_005701 [Cricetulus griseus]|uniref:Uncharacterized protein n=1 Tax=Cricetulus griseus TaxID=10029 RepID=G3H5V8_CRIGR|nr:hypothetical protein I79_005701 [Cricetulus griseus]